MPGYSLTAHHLDPSTRMGEILFGLIMTLTFTLGAGLVLQEEGREGARQMLIATLGCNLAWGIIDGVLYVLGEMFERGRRARLVRDVAATDSDERAVDVVRAAFDESLAPYVDERERGLLYASVARRLRTTALPPNRLRRSDLVGGLASGWLVVACSIPAALPFLFVDDPVTALRLSNALLLALLFFVGYRAAKYSLAKPWLAGGLFPLVGLLLVVVAIALGG